MLAYVFGKRKDEVFKELKTLCFSKLELIHDTVIGLLINKVVVNEIFMLNYRFHPLPSKSQYFASISMGYFLSCTEIYK